MSTQSPLGDRGLNLLSVLGFISLTGALLAAHSDPATGYELSIYTGTTAGFWIGAGVAFLSALFMTFSTRKGWYRPLGLVLGGMTSVAIVSLPIIRGYRSHGIHDSLTHVGWTRELSEGGMAPVEIVYPGIHTMAAFVHGTVYPSIWTSMMLVPVIIVVAFFVFVPLVVREIVDDDLATAVGAFSAFLLVPLHMISNTTHAHPSSQAILFTPVVLFLLIRYLHVPDTTSRLGVFTPLGLALFLVIVATILYHMQQAFNVILLLAVIGLIQFGASRARSLPRPSHQRLYSVTGLSILAYLGWVLQFPNVFKILEGAAVSLQEHFLGSGPETGEAVTAQTTALQAIGESLLSVFLKMFFVSTVFVVLTGIILFAAFSNRLGRPEEGIDATVIKYLGVGLLAVVPVFFVYLFGDVAAYYFRLVGFMLMIGTILGAVAIVYGVRGLSGRELRTGARLTLVCAFAVMLVLSTLVIFNSPYINRANQHVTDARVSGYQTTFEVTDESAYMAGVRQSPQRYYEALVDMEDNNQRDRNVNSSEIRRLRDFRDGGLYLALHSNTYEREIGAYKEYRFTRDDLTSVQRQVGVNRVYANGDMELYYAV